MKIAMFDNASQKFSKPIYDHWVRRGHDVKFETGANPELAAWADLTYIDWLDNNFYYLFNGPSAEEGKYQIEHYPKKRIAVRAIDIDVWMGRHRDPKIWAYLDDLITIAPHLYRKIEEEGKPPKGKHHLIRPGVDLSQFTFRKPREIKNVVGMVVGNIWECKMTFMGLQIFAMLPSTSWRLKIRGQYIGAEHIRKYYEHFMEAAGIKDRVQIDPPVADINQWYEDIDYLLMTSVKEAFSYAVGEAMAKGIKPIINNFYGSEEIWPRKYIFTTVGEAIKMITASEYYPDEYRNFVVENYNLERMLYEYDQLFGT